MNMYQVKSAVLESCADQNIYLLNPHRPWYEFVKRATDIVLSVLAILLLSPLFLITALAVKLESKGPVFYKQIRLGKNAGKFTMLKFRSMCPDADRKLDDLLHLNEKDGPIFKISNDPRVTKVGRIIRKFSIDELPQFFNVLRGDMSVVGPRPPILSEAAQYTAYEARRLSVKPGLTCYWQIGGRSNLSFQEWIALDIKYINECSFATDMKIILKTIPAVLFCRGAY